jgi:hypothetical protein
MVSLASSGVHVLLAAPSVKYSEEALGAIFGIKKPAVKAGFYLTNISSLIKNLARVVQPKFNRVRSHG